MFVQFQNQNIFKHKKIQQANYILTQKKKNYEKRNCICRKLDNRLCKNN